MFQPPVLAHYLQQLDTESIAKKFAVFQKHFGNEQIQENYRTEKETSLQGEFLRALFGDVLGYTLSPNPNFNLRREQKNETNAKEADGAILVAHTVRAVIELKDAKTPNLDKITDQAFGYHRNHSHCHYIITSNFQKLRFYIDKATSKIEFDLFNLSRNDFEVLYLCLSWDSIKSDLPQKILSESITQETDITGRLYADYSVFKKILFDNLCQKNPQFDKLTLFKKTQKLLDRILFVLFAEDRGLLHANEIERIVAEWKQLKKLRMSQPLYERFKQYFGFLNTGDPELGIFPYNGGLFQSDALLDTIQIDDEILEQHARKLAQYDFASEVDVNILGHIFEHSLTEIEEITAELSGVTPAPQKSKRKKDGIFYTPKYITSYIVEQTLGKLCQKKRLELDIDRIADTPAPKTAAQKKTLHEKLESYRHWLLGLKICDPACGSGAFLNQAFDFLIGEHGAIDELHKHVEFGKGNAFTFADVETAILENNLYGVDINDESVEIAKLSLWLRSAEKGRKLNDLSHRIKLGNSLIDDTKIGGDKAFDWHKEFPEVFDRQLPASRRCKSAVDEPGTYVPGSLTDTSGFDVVIGNPPYGADIDNLVAAYEKLYPNTSQGFKEIYKYFFDRAINHVVNPGGMLGFITPNTFFRQPRYVDLRRVLLQFSIHQLIDCGENVFDEAVPTAITILSKGEKGITQFADLSKSKHLEEDIATIAFTAINQSLFDTTPNHIFVENIRSKRENEFLLDDILEMKDAGINYQRVNVGLGVKGNSDLGQRLLYEGVLLNQNDKEYWKGSDIERYFMATSTSRFVRRLIPLASNERVILNAEYFAIAPKLIWRQTAQFPICVIDNVGVWFGRSIQAGIIKPEFSDRVSYLYLCCLLNSKYLRHLYENNVKETGRVFPQVKLEKLRSLPIVVAENQQSFITLAERMISLTMELQKRREQFLRRLRENFSGVKISRVLADFANLPFGDFLKEMAKQKHPIPLKSQDEWSEYFSSAQSECRRLQTDLSATDKEIDRLVYELYGLTDEEIAVVEGR